MHEAQYALHADLEDRHWWFAGRRAIVKRLISRLVPAASVVIDVGCGTGATAASLSPPFTSVGLDDSPDAIAHARARFPAIEYDCEHDVGKRAALFARAGAVLLMDVLEHVEDDFRLLSEILALIPIGAHVLITVPAEPALWTVHDESFGHWRRYDMDRLRATWQGLAVEERLLSAFNARLYPVVRSVRAISKLRSRPAGTAGTDLGMPPALPNRWLEQLFAGEGVALERAIDRGGPPAYARGVSLIAVLRKRDTVIPRAKPPDLPPDLWDPTRVR
jgi:SAM-dependent methyltransferase